MEMDMEQRAPACGRYEELLADYLAGECTPTESAQAELHLRDCVNCRTALEDSRAGARFLSVSLPLLEKSPEPRPEFARVAMARIRMETEHAERTGFWQPFVAFAWRFAATAMVALVILLTYAARGHNVPGRAVGVQGPLADVFTPDPTRAPASQDEFLIMVAETEHANGND
jgi:anti-sigma factor RsiW